MESNKEFIDQILTCKLLSRCGIKDEFAFNVEYVTSQREAVKKIQSLKWQNLCLQVGGDFTEFLSIHHKDKYNKYWNREVQRIKSTYMSEIEDNIDKDWIESQSIQKVVDDVKFQIVKLFMFNYYSEYYKSDFRTMLL